MKYPMRLFWSTTMLAGLLVACNHKGNEPEPVKCNIYLNNADTGMIYVIDADSLAVTDSIPGIGLALAMAVSPDGRWLYTEGYLPPLAGAASFVKTDLVEKEPVGSLDGIFSAITLLNNGELLLRGSGYGCESGDVNQLIDPSDLRIVTVFQDSLCRHKGALGQTKVAAMLNDGSRRICVTDVVSGNVYGSYVPTAAQGGTILPYTMVLHPDGIRVAVLGPRSSLRDSWFLIGDVLTGETILEHSLVYPLGQIAISDDGKYAVACDPSQSGHWDSPGAPSACGGMRLSREQSTASQTHRSPVPHQPGLHTPVTGPRPVTR
jgi:hypothetical protein